MKNSSAYNPSREEVEKAVMKYLEDGGDIQNIQFNFGDHNKYVK